MFVGGGSTYECVYLPSHRLFPEKLSVCHLSLKCREVPGDWSVSVAIGILINPLVALQVMSASSHPTKENQNKQANQGKAVRSSGSSLPPKWEFCRRIVGNR